MQFVALFRGLNVGWKNRVKMEDLRQLLLDLGLCKVKTYIQSGNAIFESSLEADSLQVLIQTSFAEHFGFQSDVVIRSIDEIRLLIESLPFSAEEIADAEAADTEVEHLYIYFLNHQPVQTQVDACGKKYDGPDLIRIGNKEVYLFCHQSIRNSKLAIRIGKVFDSSTARNLKTVLKIYEMMLI